ncbi:MAG TPA: hypothetical protein VF384_13605 [Planctomycetota bacterium]
MDDLPAQQFARGARNALPASADADARALRIRVARVHQALPPRRPGSHLAFAFDGDRNAFLAALLATWLEGHAVALPADPRRHSVAPVLGLPATTMLLHDSGIGRGLDVRALLAAPPGANAPEPAAVPLWGPLTTYGRDARGNLCSRSWTAAELCRLVDDALARLRLPAGALVWNAFRPGSPHALVPGWLAPLRAGCLLAGGPWPDGAEPPSRPVHTLVAPQALLRALSREPRRERTKLPQVVAADAALDAATVARFAETGTRVVELPCSTAAAAPDPREVRLLQAVCDLDGVADAAVAVVDLAGGPHSFCAVQAKHDTSEDLLRALPAPLQTRTTLRCVPDLGRDEDGQLGREVLLRLFGRTANGALPCTSLQWSTLAVADDRACFRTVVPRDFFAFDGHFPGYPVLSGAVQLHELVLPCLGAALGPRCEATVFLDLKFLARIAPGNAVEVALQWDGERTHAEFEVTCDGARCSAGRVVFRCDAPEPSP